jgi:hypothetical protein
LERQLAGARKALGERLRKLASLLPDTPLARFFSKVLSVLNAVQDGAAIWMAPNAAIAGIFNGLAKPPPGCNESWTPRLPKRAGVASASAVAASRVLPAAFRPVASGLFRPVVRGPFISSREAAAFARVGDSLTDQLATARALQHEMKLSDSSPSKGARLLSRKLGRLLRQAPAHYRALASALAFESIPATAEVLAGRDSGRTLARLRSALKRLGAPRALISQVNVSLDATAPGDPVDPLAVLQDPTLDELGRAAAKALAIK